MTFRKYLPLTSNEIERILKDLGFIFKRSRGDHDQWEGYIKGKRRIVTVQKINSNYSVGRMKTIIENMGLNPKEFYKANKKIAKRYFGHK